MRSNDSLPFFNLYSDISGAHDHYQWQPMVPDPDLGGYDGDDGLDLGGHPTVFYRVQGGYVDVVYIGMKDGDLV